MRSKISASGLAFFVIVCMQSPGVVATAKNICLSELYPKETLQKLLIGGVEWRPLPKAKDWPAWAAIPESVRQKFINLATQYLDKDVPSLPATLYLEYRRVGNRSNYQDVWFERRKMLHCFVLAECMEGKGRFLDAVANIVWAICEESSWTWPAHIGPQRMGVDLPDTSEPIVALFSAETASSLAWTVYLLTEEIDTAISIQICKRVEREIDQRILTPYLERDDFGWMGFAPRSDGRRPNNWNPWINSNVLAATLLIEKNEARRLALVHKVLRCLDSFVVPYPSDGSCDEGPSYWGRAGASLFDNLELLYSATDGQFNLYDNLLIRQIGRFIYRTHIAGDYFVNIGDCDARLDLDLGLVFRYGCRIQDTKMQMLATCSLTEEKLFDTEKSLRSLGRVLYTLFNLPGLSAAKSSAEPLLRDVWLGHEDMQMMAARDREGSSEGLYVASWAGHNAQSHNHNDVGNFIIYADGRPFIVDVGKPTYTRQTFSRRRYEIWMMQSSYHNVPAINGIMQREGRQYAARNVVYASTDASAELKMDIAPSYPEEARALSWLRTVRLNRAQNVQVSDSFRLKEAPRDLVQHLMTPCAVRRDKPGRLILQDSARHVEMLLEYDPEKLVAKVETIDIDDSRLSQVWGSHLYRIVLSLRRATARDTWMLTFSKRE